MAIEGVVVEIHLGIERDQTAVAGDHERINFRGARKSVSVKAR